MRKQTKKTYLKMGVVVAPFPMNTYAEFLKA